MEPTLTRATRGVVVLGGREGRAAPASSRAAARCLGEGKGAAFGAAPPSWWKPSGTRLLAAGAASRVRGGAHPDVVRIEGSLRIARAKLRARETRPLPRTIDAALSYLEEASPEALATHRVRLVALADRALVAPQPSPVAPRDDEDALDEDFLFFTD